MKKLLVVFVFVMALLVGAAIAFAQPSDDPVVLQPGQAWQAPNDGWIVVGNIEVGPSAITHTRVYTYVPYSGDVTYMSAGAYAFAEWGATAYPPAWANGLGYYAEQEDLHGCGRPDIGCDFVWLHDVASDGSFTTDLYDPANPPPTFTPTATSTPTNTPKSESMCS